MIKLCILRISLLAQFQEKDVRSPVPARELGRMIKRTKLEQLVKGDKLWVEERGYEVKVNDPFLATITTMCDKVRQISIKPLVFSQTLSEERVLL